MIDAFHQWGTDLSLGPDGDILLASSTVLGQQRILRRLLTNPGDYLWQRDYGAGLGSLVGNPAAPLHIRALIRSQIFKEAVVSHSPEPAIEVQAPPAANSTVYVNLRYSDNVSGQTSRLSFSVDGTSP